ncbi:hypothetical protein GFB49_01575 [Epibacterium sp. SM1979]|uniref:HEAT repeat protein n=1 Tax=Tritonibacter litoralis TaxID=2662264 RepID=A0A843YCD0_9RHOB|nr:HEAT repeat domain-containing protein [Tritonibacter litoralis]MQQ07134.1 hypothetical protein [Tritonibacter litoralis]
MLQHVSPQRGENFDPVPTLLMHFADGNDVIRTDAVQAMAQVAPGDDRVRQALLGALLDQDPDVRSDAMEALQDFAQPEDCDTIRNSLTGDPVREVKLAAVVLLAMLKDHASIPLFRKLTLSRAEDEVAWEDEAGLWDEWLEVQAAVIRALGHLGASDAIADMLAARDDEFGQNLDQPVFEALSQMGQDGLIWLLAIVQTETGLPRKRALEILERLDPMALVDQIDALWQDKNPEVRALILNHMPVHDPRLAQAATQDPSELVRQAALRLAADPELAIEALADPSTKVQAAALDLVDRPQNADFHATLLANMVAWARTDDGPLVSAVARNWVRLAPTTPFDLLMEIARAADRPLEARVLAVSALADLQDEAATERLISLLSNPSQQVRAAAGRHLAARGRDGDEDAVEALAAAAEAVLLPPQETPDPVAVTAEAPRLKVSDKGDIVATSPSETAVSTLEAIQINRTASPRETKAEGKPSPERKQGKNRKRQAIEGPTEIAPDLARIVLTLFQDLRDPRSGAAVLAMTHAGDDTLRYGAYRALVARLDDLRITEADAVRLLAGLKDRNANIRACCAEYAAQAPDTHPALCAALGNCHDDTDAMVRVAAARVLTQKESVLSALRDDDARIRARVLDRILSTEDVVSPEEAFETLLAGDRIVTLRQGAAQSDDFKQRILEKLAAHDLTPRTAHVLLQSLNTKHGDGAAV